MAVLVWIRLDRSSPLEGQAMSEQEAIAEFLKQEYAGKKLPHGTNQLRVGRHGGFVTLDTGTWDGQITVVGVGFDNGEYEIRGFDNDNRRFKTFDEMKAGLATFLESVTEAQLEQTVKRSLGRSRRW
jgi:hypothetical protein